MPNPQKLIVFSPTPVPSAESGPIALLSPEDLNFIATPPPFSDLVASDIGNLGTDQDGFDAIFNDAALLASQAPDVLASLDGELTGAGAVLPEFNNAEATALAADLQPASDATDTALNDYNNTLSGSGGGGTGGGGGSGTGSGFTPTPLETIIGTPNGDLSTADPNGPISYDLEPPNLILPRTATSYNLPMCTGIIQGHDSPAENFTAAAILSQTDSRFSLTLQPPAFSGSTILVVGLDTSVLGDFIAIIAVQLNNQPQWYLVKLHITVVQTPGL